MKNMTPQEFDQSDQGWRKLADEKKDLEAALLIEEYLSQHSKEYFMQNNYLPEYLYFHCGQEYAYCDGYYNKAMEMFNKSFIKDHDNWNVYVKSNIAFLERDSIELLKCIKALKEPLDQGDIKRKRVMNVMLEFLDKKDFSYSKMYDSL